MQNKYGNKLYKAKNVNKNMVVKSNTITKSDEHITKTKNPKRVLFVVPDVVGDKGGATAPLPGVAYVAGYVRHVGHSVEAIDMRIDRGMENLFAKIRRFNPDMIGLSFMAMEFKPVYEFIAELKKEFPNVKIVTGGAGGSTFEDQVIKDTRVDYVITREGERALVELLEGWPLEDVQGLVYMKDGVIKKNSLRQFNFDVSSLPFPAYDLFPIREYVDAKIPIVTSRGCPYQCTFCAMKKSMGVAWRPRTPENIVAEIKHWYNQGFRQFHFVDDNFTLDMARAEVLCGAIINSGMKIKWDLRNGIRADRVNEQLLQKMKDSGCFYFAFGIESMDQQVLDKMKKNLKVEVIYEAVKIAEKVGIPFGGFFIIGLLDDTYEKFLKSYEFAKKIPFEEVRFYNPIPFPGTELYQELVERKLLRFDPDRYLNDSSKTFSEEPIFATPEFTVEERKRALMMGQKLMMRKIMVKEFGEVAGTAAYYAWQVKPIRQIIHKPGAFLWRQIRRAKKKQVLTA